jgi:hypothetical protein
MYQGLGRQQPDRQWSERVGRRRRPRRQSAERRRRLAVADQEVVGQEEAELRVLLPKEGVGVEQRRQLGGRSRRHHGRPERPLRAHGLALDPGRGPGRQPHGHRCGVGPIDPRDDAEELPPHRLHVGRHAPALELAVEHVGEGKDELGVPGEGVGEQRHAVAPTGSGESPHGRGGVRRPPLVHDVNVLTGPLPEACQSRRHGFRDRRHSRHTATPLPRSTHDAGRYSPDSKTHPCGKGQPD